MVLVWELYSVAEKEKSRQLGPNVKEASQTQYIKLFLYHLTQCESGGRGVPQITYLRERRSFLTMQVTNFKVLVLFKIQPTPWLGKIEHELFSF